MKIVYAPQARQDLRAIRDHISTDNPRAAGRVIARIRHVIQQNLSQFPELGRQWEGGPTRALSIAGIPYRVHYRVQATP